jgi:amidophosphoribosyltransferase
MKERLSYTLPQETEKPRDNCAVVGVYSKSCDVAKIAMEGLIELNHRGQEGSGIAVTNHKKIEVVKDSGLAEVVFKIKKDLPRVPHAFVAIGHNRYSTSGSLSELQPFVEDGIAIAHNGNLTNIEQLKKEFSLPEEINGARSDTRIALCVINKMQGSEEERILKALPLFEGAYSFVFATRNALFASRDRNGFRPLVLGGLKDGGYVVASESAALRSMGAYFLRDIEPGETVRINDDGIATIAFEHKEKLSQCIFELIYISRPDSVVFGIPVMEFRKRQGQILARHLPRADVISAVPRSGIGATLGVVASEMARISGIEMIEAFYPNPYRNIARGGPRTFILPGERDKAVTEKYSVIESSIRGKNVVLVDDSIVRGSMQRIVKILRSHGASSVHALIASPPLISACYYGVDFGNGELLANRIPDIDGIRKYLSLDTLYYLSYAELLEAVLGNPVENTPEVFERNGFCGACFTGKYPTGTEGVIGKHIQKVG